MSDLKIFRQKRGIRNGGSPDFILAGSAFIDAYHQYAVTVTNNADASKVKTIDPGIGKGMSTGLFFKGVEIIRDPQFETLDAIESPMIPWEKMHLGKNNASDWI